jgi:FkbM family methyltransferase
MRTAARIGMAEPELRGLGDLVRAGDTTFDIGAAYGMYTLPLAALVGPTGRVFAFEPQPRQSNTAWTLARLVGAGQASVTRAVAGDRLDEVTLQVPIRFGVPIYGHAHVVEGTDPAHAPKRARMLRIPMLTVDEWSQRHAGGPVSFLKVDVEGFEPAVLEGARRTIDRFRPSLLLEIEDRHLLRYGDDGNAFADRIRADWPGYRMYTRVRDAWQPADRVDLTTRNYLFATDEAFERTVSA